MTVSRLQQVTAQYRQSLLQREAQAVAQLESAYAHTLAAIQPQLDKLYRQIAQAQANGEDIPLSWLYEQRRLQTLKTAIVNDINHYATFAQVLTTQMQSSSVQLGQQAGQAQLQATLPDGVTWSFGLPHPQAIVNLVGMTQAGSPLSDLFNGFGSEAADGAAKALITGLTLGNNPRQIAALVQQALGISRNRALVICRDQMVRAYRSANLETFRANSDVTDGWIWTASLSVRSCAACIAMNGTKHSLDEEFGSHPCCRCAPVPLTKSWSDILGPFGIDTSTIPDSSPSIQSGADWFDEQDADVQKEILGNAGYDVWNNNDDVSLMDFVGKSSDPDWGDEIYQRSVKQVLARR